LEIKDRIGTAGFFVQLQQMNNLTPHSVFEQAWRPGFSSTTSGIDDDDSKWVKTIRVLENTTLEVSDIEPIFFNHRLHVDPSVPIMEFFGNNESYGKSRFPWASIIIIRTSYVWIWKLIFWGLYYVEFFKRRAHKM
jgi:hypothetical protein